MFPYSYYTQKIKYLNVMGSKLAIFVNFDFFQEKRPLLTILSNLSGNKLLVYTGKLQLHNICRKPHRFTHKNSQDMEFCVFLRAILKSAL